MTGDDFLLGDEGFWQHLGTAMSQRLPLHADVIVDPSFSGRAWLAELDREILDHIAANRLVAGRMIVPPETLESPAEGFVEVALGMGVEVRVMPGLTACAIYHGDAVVLPEEDGQGRQGHRLIRLPSVVERIQALFDLRWSSAIPWDDYRKGSAGVLHLLALGWSDARIAAALGISGRTVSRRIAEAMVAAGVHTRFQLGVRYAQLGGENSPT